MSEQINEKVFSLNDFIFDIENGYNKITVTQMLINGELEFKLVEQREEIKHPPMGGVPFISKTTVGFQIFHHLLVRKKSTKKIIAKCDYIKRIRIPELKKNIPLVIED